MVKRGIPPLVTAKVVTTRLTGSASTRTCSQIIPGICIITRTLQDRGFAGTRFPILMGSSLNCDGSRRFHLAEACTVFGCSISHRRVFHWRAGQGWLFASSSAWFTPFFRLAFDFRLREGTRYTYMFCGLCLSCVVTLILSKTHARLASTTEPTRMPDNTSGRRWFLKIAISP